MARIFLIIVMAGLVLMGAGAVLLGAFPPNPVVHPVEKVLNNDAFKGS